MNVDENIKYGIDTTRQIVGSMLAILIMVSSVILTIVSITQLAQRIEFRVNITQKINELNDEIANTQGNTQASFYLSKYITRNADSEQSTESSDTFYIDGSDDHVNYLNSQLTSFNEKLISIQNQLYLDASHAKDEEEELNLLIKKEGTTNLYKRKSFFTNFSRGRQGRGYIEFSSK